MDALTILVFIALIISISLVYGVEIYRLVDEPGVDIIQGSPSDDIIRVADILEAGMEAEGDTIYFYLVINHSSPLDNDIYSIRYVVGGLIISNGVLKNATMMVAKESGTPPLAVCRLDDGSNTVEAFGFMKYPGDGSKTLEVSCVFQGESFDKPLSDNIDFMALSRVAPSSINAQGGASDTLSISKPSTPNDSVGEVDDETGDGDDMEMPGDVMSIIPFIVILVLALVGGAVYYLLRLRG